MHSRDRHEGPQNDGTIRRRQFIILIARPLDFFRQPLVVEIFQIGVHCRDLQFHVAFQQVGDLALPIGKKRWHSRSCFPRSGVFQKVVQPVRMDTPCHAFKIDADGPRKCFTLKRMTLHAARVHQLPTGFDQRLWIRWRKHIFRVWRFRCSGIGAGEHRSERFYDIRRIDGHADRHKRTDAAFAGEHMIHPECCESVANTSQRRREPTFITDVDVAHCFKIRFAMPSNATQLISFVTGVAVLLKQLQAKSGGAVRCRGIGCRCQRCADGRDLSGIKRPFRLCFCSMHTCIGSGSHTRLLRIRVQRCHRSRGGRCDNALNRVARGATQLIE